MKFILYRQLLKCTEHGLGLCDRFTDQLNKVKNRWYLLIEVINLEIQDFRIRFSWKFDVDSVLNFDNWPVVKVNSNLISSLVSDNVFVESDYVLFCDEAWMELLGVYLVLDLGFNDEFAA